MAFEIKGLDFSLVASGNLSARLYHAMDISAAGNAALATSTGGACVGVLQNTPTTGGGDGATIRYLGITKAAKTSTATAAISYGNAITVGTTVGGFGPTTGKGNVIGRALDSISSGSTGYFTLLLTWEGVGTTGSGFVT